MHRVKTILQLLLLILVVYTLLRVCFWVAYFFQEIGFTGLRKIFYWGLRLDLSAIILINLPLWIYLLFVEPRLRSRQSAANLGLLLFMMLNIPFIILNIVDIGYFSFNLRRSTIDLFAVFSDSEQAFGMFFTRYWYLFLLLAGMSLLVWLVGRKILRNNSFQHQNRTDRTGKKQLIVGAILLCVFALLVRGFGARPLTPATPLLYVPAQYQPLCENSTITFLYSIARSQTSLEAKQYFSDQALDSLFTIRRQYSSEESFQKKNIVVFVLESFSKHLVDKESPLKAKTPFLDSLMDEGIVCTSAFANGLESNKGLVALLAGLPPLMDEAYYHSSYSNNPFRGIGTILKEEGYSTNFFMGASPDHFGFGKLCKLVGIDHYYSEREYGNRKDHDGNWGIFDHKFLPYAASVIKNNSQPSFSVIFNISSHHPFKLPDDVKSQVSVQGQNAEQNSITYVDYSLRLFFDSIKTTVWYKNSIFVFVADHALTWDVKPKKVLRSAFQIPFFIHDPSQDSLIEVKKVVQQLDLVPTILDMLHYDKPFMSFGRSVLDSADNFAINKIFGNLQLFYGDFLLGYNESNERPAYFYHYPYDSLLQNNLLDQIELIPGIEARERKLKAVLQRYNNSLLRHQLTVR